MQTTDLFADDVQAAVAFLDTYYRDAIGELLQKYPADQDWLTVSYTDLTRSNDLAQVADAHGFSSPREFFHNEPEVIHDLLEDALVRYDKPAAVHDDFEGVTVRISDLPESLIYGVEELWQAEYGEFCGVRGQIQKLDAVRKKAVELRFECQRCGSTTLVPQLKDEEDIQTPHECSGCERQGPFVTDEKNSEYIAHQLARVQQPPEETKGGDAAFIDVPLESRLVTSVEAGDRVTFAGRQELKHYESGLFDPYLKPEAVEIEETDFDEVDTAPYEDEIKAIADGKYGTPLEAVVDSIAPKIHGLREIKRAMALQMFGGVRVEHKDGSADRGDIHLLMIGAPGTGKSKLLSAQETLAPRSVYASGKGASAAGMTAAAVRDNFGSSEWTLEAGALVLANKGIACVDEIDKVDEEARSSMHEALENQRVNVNKAGINANLPAQTSLLAAGNPKYGRFDKYASESLSEQIDLGPTLLSRFDLIYLLEDHPDREKDYEVSDHIVESKRAAVANERSESLSDEQEERITPTIDSDTLRAYVAYAKQNITPRIDDDEVAEELKQSFTEWRVLNGEAEDVAVPVTYRKLDGVMRLAEASARLRLSETVTKDDVDIARSLIMESMRQIGMNTEDGFDADVVESGTTKSQRERIGSLRSIIEELAEEHTAGAPHEEVISRASDAGMDRDEAQHEIRKLKMQGDVYEPKKPEYYQLV